ncbi:MAG: hypothetical protein JWO82_2875 [Akkermansiaceae bacterium]|nr:hypothetical protein [Akkermansiaceae bacterium]
MRGIICFGDPGVGGWGIFQDGGRCRAAINGTFFGDGPLPQNTWSHIALVRNGGIATLYVNGQAAGSSSLTPVYPPSSYSSSYFQGSIGCYQVALPSSPLPVSFVGNVDEFRFFTFAAGQFSLNDLLLSASRLAVEQSADVPLAPGSTVSLDRVAPGESSSMVFTLKSLGVSPLTSVKATIGGIDRNLFSLEGPVPSSIAAGDSATFTVRFSPVIAGRRSGLLRIVTNDPLVGTFDVNLSGRTPGREIRIEQPAGVPLFSNQALVSSGSFGVPNGLDTVQTVAAGLYHALALKKDGTVVAWGATGGSGETDVPRGLTGVRKIAAGDHLSVALKEDGSLVFWGTKANGVQSPPVGLSGVVDIAAGNSHVVALKNDGTVVGWGFGNQGQLNITDLSGITGIGASDNTTFALKGDGTVFERGPNASSHSFYLNGLKNVSAFSAVSNSSLALLRTGTVSFRNEGFSGTFQPPAGLANVVAVATSTSAAVALKSDRTVAGWAASSSFNTFDGLTAVKSVSGGKYYVTAVADSTVEFERRLVSSSSSPKTFTIRSIGSQPLDLSGVTLDGPNAQDFSVDAVNVPSVLAGESGKATFTVSFTPHGQGVRIATLRVPNNDPNRSDFSVSLKGQGFSDTPEISVFSGTTELASGNGSVTLPKALTGTVGAPQTITIQNTGNVDLFLYGPELGGSQAVDFNVDSALPGPLAPGASTTLTVALTPRFATGMLSAVLSIYSNDADEKTFIVNLKGEAQGPEISVEPERGAGARGPPAVGSGGRAEHPLR